MATAVSRQECLDLLSQGLFILQDLVDGSVYIGDRPAKEAFDRLLADQKLVVVSSNSRRTTWTRRTEGARDLVGVETTFRIEFFPSPVLGGIDLSVLRLICPGTPVHPAREVFEITEDPLTSLWTISRKLPEGGWAEEPAPYSSVHQVLIRIQNIMQAP